MDVIGAYQTMQWRGIGNWRDNSYLPIALT